MSKVPGGDSPSNPFLQQKPIDGVKRVILVGSGKGGVGKSTVSCNLAVALKHQGQKVGLLDADIYGPSLPRMMGALNQKPTINEQNKIQPIVRHGIKLMSLGFMVDEGAAIVWRGPMLFKALDQFFRDVEWGELDTLLVDLPPGTGDVALTIAQKVPVFGAVVVCTPQNLALADAKKAVDMFERVNIPILGFVENMSGFAADPSQPPMALFPKGDLNQYLDAKGLEKLVEIPFLPQLSLCGESGVPVLSSDPKGSEAACFTGLAQGLLKH